MRREFCIDVQTTYVYIPKYIDSGKKLARWSDSFLSGLLARDLFTISYKLPKNAKVTSTGWTKNLKVHKWLKKAYVRLPQIPKISFRVKKEK